MRVLLILLLLAIGQTSFAQDKPETNLKHADVVGSWLFTIVTPDDQTLNPTLTLEVKDEKLVGKYTSFGQDITPANLEIVRGELRFDIVTALGDNRLDVSFTGIPRGDEMTGELNYAVDGNVGDIDFTAKRQKDAKPESPSMPDAATSNLNAQEIGGEPHKDSPRFRGVGGRGVSPDDVRLPDVWSQTQNVAWSIDVPGYGWASPVVWGDKVFVATVVAERDDILKPSKGLYLGKGVRDPAKGIHHWMVYCYDFATGEKLWEQEAHAGQPQVPRHPKSTYAAETPATDGERLYVLFGDLGLYCYDLDGNPLWKRDIEPQKTLQDYGAAASPIVDDGQVIVVYDNFGPSWIASFDAKTGNDRWRTERDETHSWATPLIWKNKLRTEIVVPGKKRNRSYDLDGQLLWEFDGRMSGLVIPSPFVAHEMCYIASGYVGDAHRPTFAIKPGASGDFTPEGGFTDSEFIQWYQPTASAYNTTQLVYGDFLYTVYDQGFMTCHNAKTGEEIYGKKRFSPSGSFTASPWAYNGKVFCLSEDGLTYVIQAGAEFKLLGTNDLSELAIATPAVANGKLLIRTASKIYCVGKN
ncbi:PQQ-binding-like beta-propeller repeat protein [Stieleria marina]|uniref:Outer membrane biogenesis protein BamB n=1 Tax=Stieleria marina TaxID=1930275 RepID=A0A517P1D8_9BACT|nr:outer membrane biogenesis protein BamB [Planctomycetes bacterium K23_9]